MMQKHDASQGSHAAGALHNWEASGAGVAPRDINTLLFCGRGRAAKATW
jgi:hypothetical protein